MNEHDLENESNLSRAELAARLREIDAELTNTSRALWEEIEKRRHAERALREAEDRFCHLEAQFLQAQKMEALGVLAAGIVHDFNNLLNVINGYSELVLDNPAVNGSLRRDIEYILESGKRAAGLAARLLAFSRKQAAEIENLNINTLILDMSSMFGRLIGEDITLEVKTQPNLRNISANRGQIEQVIMNLVVNARDAMPQGGRLTIETADIRFDEGYQWKHQAVNPGDYSMLAIRDNGIGMDSATQDSIFEPFFTTKTAGKGSGLGLSTVFGIVKQSSGLIAVDSASGKGTTFKIYFPSST